MARILVLDPSPEIHELVSRVVARRGHVEATFGGGDWDETDLVIVEPGSVPCRAIAETLVKARPGLRVICLSIYPRSSESRALQPCGYLMKPFALAELERAVDAALAEPRQAA